MATTEEEKWLETQNNSNEYDLGVVGSEDTSLNDDNVDDPVSKVEGSLSKLTLYDDFLSPALRCNIIFYKLVV